MGSEPKGANLVILKIGILITIWLLTYKCSSAERFIFKAHEQLFTCNIQRAIGD